MEEQEENELRVREIDASEWDSDPEKETVQGTVTEEGDRTEKLGEADPWSEHWRPRIEEEEEDEARFRAAAEAAGLGPFDAEHAHTLHVRNSAARQMLEVERYRNENCHFWRVFDGTQRNYRRDHLQQTYHHLLSVLAQQPEAHQVQFTPRRRAIVERVIADDSDPEAQEFLLFSFMCTLRGMYELFVLHPELHVHHGIRVTDVSGLKFFWTQVLSHGIEAFRSGGYGNAEAPLTERLVAFVRHMRVELFCIMGAPVPPPELIERRVRNNMRQRRERHERQHAVAELRDALIKK